MADLREEVCGSEINYDSDFEAIKQEISKSEGIDYNLVEEKALYILNQKSKDIRVFSYLALCYLKKEDWCHFCDLFEALMFLTKERFDALFPVRLQGKMMAFKWLNESRFTQMLENATVSNVAHDQMNRLVSVLENLKESLMLKFPDSSPFPEKLYEFAKKWQKITGQTPEKSQQIKNTESSDWPVSKENAKKTEFSDELIETTKTALDSVRKCALFLIEKEPEKTTGYRLMRVVRWGNIEMLPFAEANKTRIEPPSQERREYLLSLLEKSDYRSALAFSEKMFSSGNTLFWMDLQRVSANAANKLGNKFTGVKETIVFETASFLNRHPHVRNLKYVDGTPFCDPETERWIELEVIPLLPKNENGNWGGNQIKTKKEVVESSIVSNNNKKNTVLFEDGIRRDGNEFDNFRRRLSIVSVMLNAKRPDIALLILESLYEVAETYYLDRWIPSMAMELFDLMIKTYEVIAKEKKGDKKSVLIEKREIILKKICYLDPETALNYKPFDER